jgi:hypothetical protein
VKSKTAIGALLLAGSVFAAGGGFYAVHSLKQKRFDPETLCPLAGAKALAVILIDKTDPLTAGEQERIRELVVSERDAAEPAVRVAIQVLSQKTGTDETAATTVADLCNPGSEGNPLFENPKRVAARYRQAFVEPIEAALISIAGAGSAPASPIALAIHTSVDARAGAGGTLRLVLISDLLEHTADASAYAGTFSEVSLRRAIPERTQIRLKQAAVNVFLLSRPMQMKQQEAAVAIWRQFFEKVTGRPPSIERLEKSASGAKKPGASLIRRP